MYLQTFSLLGMPHTNQQITLLTLLLTEVFKRNLPIVLLQRKDLQQQQ